VLGMTAGVVIAVYHQPQIRYTQVDDASGVVRESYGAPDAPEHFGEQVIRHYLWEYVTLRERFVWAMDPETDRRVKLMSAPAEQVRYAAEREKEAPGSKYGINGYARVVRFAALTLRGKGKDKTLEYDVQFVKGEVTASNPNAAMETHMTARIIFAFHPELPMSAADRLDNEPGLMVISYVSTSDGR
jgi:type IV secretion system protein VirB8